MILDSTPDKFIRKFLPNNSSPDKPQMILVCGISCIGKSYFCHRINEIKTDNKWRIKWRSVGSPRKLNTSNNLYHTRTAIILGIPGSEYQKRIRKREKFTNHHNVAALNSKLTRAYNRWIEALNDNQISYIFVDGRNNYPVLDTSSFFNLNI